MSGVRSIAALVVAATLGVALAAAPPAAADAPAGRAVDGPGLAYVRVAAPGLDAAARTAAPTAPTAAASAFVAPPNDDFVLHFARDVPPAKRQVFEAAAGIWSEVLEVEVPIEVSVRLESFPDPTILGGAAPTDLFADDPAFPRTGTWYVPALANQFLGRDADPDEPEIDVVVSSDYTFHEGIDGGPVPADRIALLTLALHELAHGLGHTTLATSLGAGTATIRFDGLPLAFDRHIADDRQVPLTSLDPVALGRALTQRLLWTGREAALADGGLLPELYAPPVFQQGSSVSHLDEGTYGSDLMTPFISGGELRTEVPALTRAMMADFGWGLEATTLAERFVTAVTRDFVKRFPTPSEMRDLSRRLDTGSATRHSIARAHAYSDEWIGRLLDSYYLRTLGRRADAAGRTYWSAELRQGTAPAEVAARFFASSEYFARAGASNRAWVVALYRGILGRDPDPAGGAAWTAALDAGASRIEVASSIYQAPESRAARVRGLYLALLGRAPDPEGLASWTEVLRDGRDIELAIQLASSPEYEERAARRFG